MSARDLPPGPTTLRSAEHHEKHWQAEAPAPLLLHWQVNDCPSSSVYAEDSRVPGWPKLQLIQIKGNSVEEIVSPTA